MKQILLDHCVPRTLRRELKRHDVYTAKFMGWHKLPDADLLKRASQQFDIIITCDHGIPEQRPAGVSIAMIILSPCNR